MSLPLELALSTLPTGLARALPVPLRLPARPTRQGAYVPAPAGAGIVGLRLARWTHRAPVSVAAPLVGVLRLAAAVLPSAPGADQAVPRCRRQARPADDWSVTAAAAEPGPRGPTWADVRRAVLALTLERRPAGLPARAREVVYEVTEEQWAASAGDTTSSPGGLRARSQVFKRDLGSIADAVASGAQGEQARHPSAWLSPRARPAGLVRHLATQSGFAEARPDFGEHVGWCRPCHGERADAEEQGSRAHLTRPLRTAAAIAMPRGPRMAPTRSTAVRAALARMKAVDDPLALRKGCGACDICHCRACAGLTKGVRRVLCAIWRAPGRASGPSPSPRGGGRGSGTMAPSTNPYRRVPHPTPREAR